jgi:hypothetical protein
VGNCGGEGAALSSGKSTSDGVAAEGLSGGGISGGTHIPDEDFVVLEANYIVKVRRGAANGESRGRSDLSVAAAESLELPTQLRYIGRDLARHREGNKQ